MTIEDMFGDLHKIDILAERTRKQRSFDGLSLQWLH